MRSNPIKGGGDARIIGSKPGIQQAFEASVGHASVTAKCACLRRHLLTVSTLACHFTCETLATIGGRVSEASVSVPVLRPRCVVALDILSALHEHQGALHGGVIGRDASIVQCVKHELRVGEVGASVTSVSRTTKPIRIGADPLGLVPLIFHKPRSYSFHLHGERGILLRGKAHEHHAGHVVGQSAAEVRLKCTRYLRSSGDKRQGFARVYIGFCRESSLCERLQCQCRDCVWHGR